jgi:hypothetical protein
MANMGAAMHKHLNGHVRPTAGELQGASTALGCKSVPKEVVEAAIREEQAFLVGLRDAIRDVVLHAIGELPSFRGFPYFPADGPEGAPSSLVQRVAGVQTVKKDVCKLLDQYSRWLGAGRRLGRKPEKERDEYARQLKAQGLCVKEITERLTAEGYRDVNGKPFSKRAVRQALWRMNNPNYKPKPRAKAYRPPGYQFPVAGQVPEG